MPEDHDDEREEQPEHPQRLFTLTEAERARQELEPFLIEAISMASIKNGSSSWRARSASVRVNNRWGCSGCSSRSSSWSSGILFRPFQGQLKTYRKDSMRWSRSLA